MTLVAAGFPGSVNDLQWSKLVDLIANDAVAGMTITTATGDRRIQVGTGRANVGGILFEITGAESLTLGANNSGRTRFDLIVAEATWADKQIRLRALTGTPGTNPLPPTPTRNPGDIYQVPLANVRIATGQGTLNAGDLTRVAPPPPTDFYRITSIATAPDPSQNALVFYTPSDSLMAVVDGEYREIANARPSNLLRRSVTAGGGVSNGITDFMGTMATNFSRGTGWDVGSQHSSQFQVPETGYYRVAATAFYTRAQTGQLGYVYLQLRGGTTANVPASGTTMLEAVSTLVNGYLYGELHLYDIIKLTVGTRYHFAVENATNAGLVTVYESSGRSWFLVEQVDDVRIPA